MKYLALLRDYFDSLVHPSVRHDPMAAARHSAFIWPRFAAGLIALTLLPIHLAIRGVPSAAEVLLFGALLLPLVAAYVLSKTGRYDQACLFSAAAMAALATLIAGSTGGLMSFACAWFVVVPIEAALSGSRRVVGAACAFVMTGTAILIVGDAANLLPAPPTDAHTLAPGIVGIVSASLYAAGIALSAQWFDQTHTRRLMTEEARYKLLARNMTDVVTVHGRGGTISFASAAAERIFGVPHYELTGHGLFDRVHVGDRPAYLTALSDAAAGGCERSVEFRVRRSATQSSQPATHFTWVEMRCRPLDLPLNESGEHEVVAVIRDISERKSQEQSLQIARSDAERANAAKSQFLATMSHELRTPLNAIIGFSDMLMNENALKLDSAKRTEYAHLINESGTHLLSVVNGILDMSKIEGGHFVISPEPFAPAPVIRRCCDILALKAREAGIEIVTDVPLDIEDITGDRRALKQIVINLISNAIKFSHADGRVKVRARMTDQGLVVSVEDQGIGIGSDDLARIGSPFFQVANSYDRCYEGAGLGLSIVKGLVDLHGGRVMIDSALGKGTQISVHLPKVCKRTHADTKAAPSKIVAEIPIAPAMTPPAMSPPSMSPASMSPASMTPVAKSQPATKPASAMHREHRAERMIQ